MGFAPVAATTILLVAGMFGASVFFQDWRAAQESLQDAERQADRLRAERVDTEMSIDEVLYAPGVDTLTVTATNVGETTLRASELDWIVGGTWENDVILSAAIEGDATRDLWTPGSELVVIFLPISPAPTSIVVVAGNGAKEVWPL